MRSKDAPLFGEGSASMGDAVLPATVVGAALKAREIGASIHVAMAVHQMTMEGERRSW